MPYNVLCISCFYSLLCLYGYLGTYIKETFHVTHICLGFLTLRKRRLPVSSGPFFPFNFESHVSCYFWNSTVRLLYHQSRAHNNWRVIWYCNNLLTLNSSRRTIAPLLDLFLKYFANSATGIGLGLPSASLYTTFFSSAGVASTTST